jgi:serine/threonine protein kinase
MMQMAKGLRYLHEKEVAHRNIKPENIFRMDGRVKIGDLDLAGIYKIKSTQQLTGGAGFPLYKAPEAHQSNAYYL